MSSGVCQVVCVAEFAFVTEHLVADEKESLSFRRVFRSRIVGEFPPLGAYMPEFGSENPDQKGRCHGVRIEMDDRRFADGDIAHDRYRTNAFFCADAVVRDDFGIVHKREGSRRNECDVGFPVDEIPGAGGRRGQEQFGLQFIRVSDTVDERHGIQVGYRRDTCLYNCHRPYSAVIGLTICPSAKADERCFRSQR